MRYENTGIYGNGLPAIVPTFYQRIFWAEPGYKKSNILKDNRLKPATRLCLKKYMAGITRYIRV